MNVSNGDRCFLQKHVQPPLRDEAQHNTRTERLARRFFASVPRRLPSSSSSSPPRTSAFSLSPRAPPPPPPPPPGFLRRARQSVESGSASATDGRAADRLGVQVQPQGKRDVQGHRHQVSAKGEELGRARVDTDRGCQMVVMMPPVPGFCPPVALVLCWTGPVRTVISGGTGQDTVGT